jgi:hypothetical protein
MRSVCLALAVLALVGAGCGSSSTSNATPTSSPASESTGSSPASSSAGPIDPKASDSEATTTGAGSDASDGSDSSSSGEVPATATLARACARAGVPGDAQTLTVSGAAPDELVGYSTAYSDHSNELTNPSYTSGYGYGPAGADGVYRATWTVPANAPAGTAMVGLVSGGPIQESVSFLVVASTGTCP